MRPNTRAFRIELILIILACSLPIVIHVINSMNSRMLADDFCFAANVFGKGLSGAMHYYYYNWQGTFSSTAVQSTIALSGGGLVRWLPSILILSWWFGLILLSRQLCVLLKFQDTSLTSVALATLILYGILEGTPTVFQSIYWTSGSVTYALPMVLFTLWNGLLLYFIRQQLANYIVVCVALVAGLGAALLAGFSPIFAIFELGVLALVLCAIWIQKSTHYRTAGLILAIAIIGAIIGTIIMIAAPGNSVRQALFNKPSSLLALIGINLTATASYIGIDLSAFSLVPNLVLLVVGGWVVSRRLPPSSPTSVLIKRNPRKWLGGALGIAIVLLFGIFLPTSYNISGFPPGRALIIPHSVVIILALVWGSVMALSAKKTAPHVSTIMIIAVTALLAIGPIYSASKSLAMLPKLRTFSTEWDARDTAIRQAISQNKDQIMITPFSVDLADYVNVGAVEGEFASCLKDYYKVQNLTIQNQPE